MSTYFVGSPTLLHTCCGTILAVIKLSNLAAALPVKSMTTLFPSTMTDLALPPKVSLHRPMSSSAGYCFFMFSVNATSSAVSGWPFDHLTPSRIVNESLAGPSHL